MWNYTECAACVLGTLVALFGIYFGKKSRAENSLEIVSPGSKSK